MDVKYQINKLEYDSFGRPSGILLLDKKADMTAHDLVNIVRKKLDIRKVGHAGALDNFSTGLMLILVGKATKLSEKLMGMEKIYNATMILGVATETQDTESNVTKTENPMNLTEEEIKTAVLSFLGGYEQNVSPFSSVKVAGRKLRKVLRNKGFTYKITGDATGRFIELYTAGTETLQERIQIPKRFIEIKAITVNSCTKIKGKDLPYKDPVEGEFWAVDFNVHCSKGTYIRQLAEDIGAKLHMPASLIALRRIKIGDFDESMLDHSLLS